MVYSVTTETINENIVCYYLFAMNLIYNVVPLYLLLDVCMSLRNHLPHDDGYFHYSDQAMQRDNNYQHYDSYSSQELDMRKSPRKSRLRSRYDRHIDFSDSEYTYRCKCSCQRCEKETQKPACCEKFCSTECSVHNNIIVVPYPVPFVVPPPSSEFPITPIPTPLPATTTTTTTTTSTERTTTTEGTSTTTEMSTFSTVPFFQQNQKHKRNNRFQILNENLRRSMGNNGLRSSKFGRLPKYGIVPLPENLALSLMQQIRKDQNIDQFRNRLANNKKHFDDSNRPNVQSL